MHRQNDPRLTLLRFFCTVAQSERDVYQLEIRFTLMRNFALLVLSAETAGTLHSQTSR